MSGKNNYYNNNKMYDNGIKTILFVILLVTALILGKSEIDLYHIPANENTESVGNLADKEVITDKVDVKISDWYEQIPPFNGTPYVEVNHNIPFFTDKELKTKKVFENYSDLDELGRCGTAYANVCEELMPTEERENISHVKPTGWVQKQYKMNGKQVFLYNRSHLIAFSLCGENDNEKNLITGTDFMNHDGMIPFETTVREYIDDNPSKHVLYRVTPVFIGDELVARGVLMEAASVEDHGYDVSFCVFVYNNQPGISIDYATGNSKETRK